MCNVGFEIDVMQTWQFDMNIGECLVEREHVNDDTPFKWLAPEPFTNILQWCPAEKTLNLTNGASTGDFISPHIVVAFTVDQQEVAYAAMYSGIYSGIGFRSFPVANYQDASMFILELQTRTGGNPIVAVFMSPVEITTSPKVIHSQARIFYSNPAETIPIRIINYVNILLHSLGVHLPMGNQLIYNRNYLTMTAVH